MSIISNWGYNRRATHFLCAKSSLMKNHLKLSLFETDWNVFLFFPKCLFNFLTWIQSFLLDYNLSPPMNITPLMDQNQTFCHLTPPDQSLGSLHLSWPIPWLCLLLLLSVRPPPPLSLPGMWKANEESWAEGSFCVLVKKNNLCQRKVLQQLCCRTCSLKGWWEVPQGAGGGHPSTQAHSLSHIIYKKICAS